MHQRLPTHLLLWNILRVVRHKICHGPYFLKKSGRVDDDVQISVLDAFYEMDGRKSRFIGEVLDWYRREDAGDLKRSELNQLVEKLTRLNALEGKFGKFYPKIVMDEELVQNGVMDAKNGFERRDE